MKSIFLKQFAAMALIILVSFGMLGGTLGVQLYNYMVNEKKENLTKVCDGVAQRTIERIEMESRFSSLDKLLLEDLYAYYDDQYLNSLLSYAKDSGSFIFVALPNGEITYYTDGRDAQSGSAVTVQPLSEATMRSIVAQDPYSAIGKLDGYFAAPMFNVGVPIYTEQRNVVCVVIVSSQLRNLASMFYDVIGNFLLTVTFVVTLAFVVAWIITNSMTRPLKQLRDAARCFERGNFDVKLRVRGDDEIAEVGEAFNSMALSLAKLESLRSDFVANVSHEMKTPMTTISGFIDGILDGTIPKEKEAYYLEIISGEIRRLSRLVQRTLVVSRLQSGSQAINPAPMDIAKLIGHIVVGFEQKINEKRLQVNVEFSEPEVYVYADADAVNQVVYNLVDNAIKYADEGGRVDVEVTSRGSYVGIKIGNTGECIAPEDLPFIFDRFFKSDRSRGLHSSSYGLGLYIAKSIVNSHGEDLRVRSENGYTEFSFHLKTTDRV